MTRRDVPKAVQDILDAKRSRYQRERAQVPATRKPATHKRLKSGLIIPVGYHKRGEDDGNS